MRAGDGASAEFLPLLRRQAGQTRRGHHRDPPSRAAALESDPDRAREVHLPVLREDHPASRTLSRHRPRAGWGELVGDDPLRQVWRAPAAQPAERIVCPGRHRARRVDPRIREGRLLADWVGACTASLAPLIELIRRHVLAGERLHGDDTTVPVLAKDKTVIGRLWTPTFARAGFMSGMTGRSPAQTRQQRCSFTPAIAAASTRAGISPAMPGSSRPMLAPVLGPANGRTRGPGLAISTTPGVGPARSPRRPAGATAGANSSYWPLSANRRLLSQRSARSTKSSRSSVGSTALRPSSGSRSARIGSGRLSASSRDGCVPNAPGCHVMPTLPRRWTTCSSAGLPSPAFSTMAGSVSATTPLSALYAGSRSDASRGCSPAPPALVSALPRSTP